MNLEPLACRLREAVLDVLWRQWRAVGAQAVAGERAHSVVDPEALILTSLTLMREELRFADEHAPPIHLAGNTTAGGRLKISDSR